MGSLEEWSKVVFQNHVMKSYSEVMEHAAEMKCTMVRFMMAFAVLGGSIFNVYAICSNFGSLQITSMNFNNATTIEKARVGVFSFELIAMLGMVGYLVYYIVKNLCCKGVEESAEGETSLTIVRQIQNIGMFSLVKGAADIKYFVGQQFTNWRTIMDRPDKSKCEKRIEFCFWFWVKLVWIILSVIAFLLKLSQVAFVTQSFDSWTQSNYISFFGFVNNMISLYSPPRIALNAVWTFVFAGADSTYTAAEKKLQTEFMECLAYKLTNGNSFLGGHAILLTLGVADVQRLLLKDVGKVEFVGEVADDL